ncbi:hypothetical protein FPOAC2_13137 [Fusarium poae]|jgi:hypothetical protein
MKDCGEWGGLSLDIQAASLGNEATFDASPQDHDSTAISTLKFFPIQRRKKHRKRYRIETELTIFDTKTNMTEDCKVPSEGHERKLYHDTMWNLTASSTKSIKPDCIYDRTGVFGVSDNTGIR